MKKEHKITFLAFFISIVLGILGSHLAFHFLALQWQPWQPANIFPFITLLLIVVPILVFLLLFVLSRKFFSIIWEKIKMRSYCVLLMLLAYMLGSIFSYCFYYHGHECLSPKVLLALPFVILHSLTFAVGILVYPMKLYLIFPSILAIASAYIATKGIKKWYFRVLGVVLLTCLIYMVALTHIVIRALAA